MPVRPGNFQPHALNIFKTYRLESSSTPSYARAASAASTAPRTMATPEMQANQTPTATINAIAIIFLAEK
jgi:hypothetical protein